MKKESIYIITDGIENAGLSLHYIGVSSAGLSKIGLLNIDNKASIGRKFTRFFFSCLHGKQYMK